MTQEFPEVFDGHIRTMPGEEFRIHLRDDAQPFCVTTPRRVPLSLRDKLGEELKRLETEGIIRRVTEPTEWCAPIVVAPKKDGRSIRLCVDLSHLNKYVKREVYQFPNSYGRGGLDSRLRSTVVPRLRRLEGVSPVSPQRRQPASDDVRHAVWAVRLPQGSIRRHQHQRALQSQDGRGLRRNEGVPKDRR